MKTFRVDPRVLTFVVLGLLLFAPGCATPTKTKTVSDALPRPGAKVVVGTVTNETGHQFDFDVSAGLRAALAAQLQRRELLAAETPAPGDVLLNLTITDYRPGSAFKRWVLPGWGVTVLAVKGALVELDGRTAVAQIDHQRTVAAGGFYTVGAEHYVLDDVARELSGDLQTRISKGGDFVVTAGSRGDVVTATEPRPDARTAWVMEVNDRRPELGRIGERHAAFGVSMGDVYFSRNVAGFIRESLELELTAAGYRLSNTNAAVNVSCEVKQFWLHTRTTAFYWDVIADISVTVSNRSQTPAQARAFSATARKRTYVWPTASLCGKVIDESMANLMNQLRADDSWR